MLFNEAVKRNSTKFPTDIMFQISREEWDSLRSQFATLKTGRGAHCKYLPHAFTEHGALMAAMVLNSPRAVEMSALVIRAFVQLRKMLVDRLDELERKLSTHDQAITGILTTMREMMNPPPTTKRGIGFT